MTDIVQSLQSGNDLTVRWADVHAIKLGPYSIPARLKVRAFTDHYQGNASSTAWMKLYYERDLVDEASKTGNPIPLEVSYLVYLAAGSGVSLRLETGNHISTVQDFGFEVTFSPA